MTGQSTGELDKRENRQHPEIHLALSSPRIRELRQELDTKINTLRVGLTGQDLVDFDVDRESENQEVQLRILTREAEGNRIDALVAEEKKRLAREFLTNNPELKALYDKSPGANDPVVEINLSVAVTQLLDWSRIKPQVK